MSSTYERESPAREDASLRTQDEAAAAVAVAPRVTLDDINAEIVAVNYLNAGRAAEALGQPASDSAKLLTLCVVTLRNGFTVTGESACASPENYNEALGNDIALRHAKEKIWPLLGFRLRDGLSRRPSDAT